MLAATAELLGEQGYPKLRVGDVAQRARVGLGTVYRRWPSKRDLVIASLADAAPDLSLPTTADATADLLTALRAIADALAGPKGQLLSGLLTDVADDPDLAQAARETVITPSGLRLMSGCDG